jgi:hypothetical protein
MATPSPHRGVLRRTQPTPWKRAVGRAGPIFLIGCVVCALCASPGSSRTVGPRAAPPAEPVARIVVQAQSHTCPRLAVSPAYTAAVYRAVGAKRDIWGEKLLEARGGPTYEAAAAFLTPLLYGQQRKRRPLTPSGVYYLAFAYPRSVLTRPVYSLHVADGSQIITRRVGSASLTIDVGPYGQERYGACLAWLTPARLANGYLPILQTSYVDRNGVRYTQESFAGRIDGLRTLIAFVKLEIDARASRAAAVVRLVPSRQPSTAHGDRLDGPDGTRLIVGSGSAYDGRAFRYHVPAGKTSVVYAQWLLAPTRAATDHADRATYDKARAEVAAFWGSRLANAGTVYTVPEKRIEDAQRAILIQQIAQTWRYSAGNPYEELSYSEGTDTAEVMGRYGFQDVADNILRFSLTRLQRRYTAWRAGERLVAEANHFELYGDRKLLEHDTPVLAWAVRAIAAQQVKSGHAAGRLAPERLCSDEADPVDSVIAQSVAWQGLMAMQRVWGRTGHVALAARARTLALSLEAALRPAIDRSLVRLSDGTIYLPYSLSASSAPYDNLSDTRMGSYWNLVAPYALASGIIRPGTPTARGVIAYLLAHGSRLLGVPRADAHIIYGNERQGVASGLGQIYGLATARFLAENDRPDLLVLSLYGTLAAGMTRNTFISGEAVSVVPLGTTYFRKTYMPPNSGSNSTFLETLRLILVQERRGAEGAPRGLDLAFATPRGWLAPGKTIRVTGAPTSFGRLSYSVERNGSTIVAHVKAPARTPSLRLRLRLPAGERLGAVSAGPAGCKSTAPPARSRFPLTPARSSSPPRWCGPRAEPEVCRRSTPWEARG